MLLNQFFKSQSNMKSIIFIRHYARSFNKKHIRKSSLVDNPSLSEFFADEVDDPRINPIVNKRDFEDVDTFERQTVKKAIIHKKIVKKDRYFSILTRRAVEQMFYIYNEDKLSSDDLVDLFPISLDFCAKLLKFDLKPLTLPELIQQNEVMINHLYLLRALCKKQTLDKYVEFQWIISEDKFSLLKYANGNYTLPFPEKSMLDLTQELEEKRIPGQMESLYNLTTLRGKGQQFLPSKRDDDVLKKQNAIIESIISYFKTESEVIVENEKRLQPKEKRSLNLPNKAIVDYTNMFKYKIND